MAKYASVNGAWPEGTNDGRDLKPTPQEAITACRKLYRFAMGRPFRGKVQLTSGRRYTWIRRGVLYVNPDQRHWRGGGGWHELVHSMSHYCARRLHVGAKPHGHQHAFLERSMIEHAVNSGWLEGKLRRPQRPQPVRNLPAERFDRLLARIKQWEAKQRRATTALKKLRRQAAGYQRRLAAAATTPADQASAVI